jgi:hypothetical protein
MERTGRIGFGGGSLPQAVADGAAAGQARLRWFEQVITRIPRGRRATTSYGCGDQPPPSARYLEAKASPVNQLSESDACSAKVPTSVKRGGGGMRTSSLAEGYLRDHTTPGPRLTASAPAAAAEDQRVRGEVVVERGRRLRLELGKVLAQRILGELEAGVEPRLEHDSSTNALIRRYRRLRRRE